MHSWLYSSIDFDALWIAEDVAPPADWIRARNPSREVKDDLGSFRTQTSHAMLENQSHDQVRGC